jgi:peptide/nickel transport system permease protein
MFNYLVRRILIGFVTLLLITFVVYGLLRNMPGNPLTIAQGVEDPSKKLSKADQERMIKAYGLDKPWPQAYLIWMSRVVRFDLGQSITRKQPVTRLIAERIGPTLLLSIPALVFTFALSIPLGLYASARSGKPDERALSTSLYMLYSFPAFVAALLLQIVFSVHPEWLGLKEGLPLIGMKSDNYEELNAVGKMWDILKHMILPVVCETYGGLAYYSRFVAANLEEVVRQDFIRTARAKGVSRTKILVHHAMRNTLLPLVTLLGLSLPGILSGAVILEQIFTWPGMGRLFFEAIRERDYETVMGLTLMFSILTLLGQLLADILYAMVDPRVSYS